MQTKIEWFELVIILNKLFTLLILLNKITLFLYLTFLKAIKSLKYYILIDNNI